MDWNLGLKSWSGVFEWILGVEPWSEILSVTEHSICSGRTYTNHHKVLTND